MECDCTTIDNYLKEAKVKDEIGLIKTDVEGIDKEVIEGALETIQEHKPILLISVYHTGKDFFETWEILKSFGYRFYLVSLSKLLIEKVLVALP